MEAAADTLDEGIKTPRRLSLSPSLDFSLSHSVFLFPAWSP
jgi:hypothetical protein